MIELVGYVGALCFAFCAMPQAIKCHREKSADGLSWLFLILWLVGEICVSIYTYFTIGMLNPLMLNYAGNLIFLTVMIYYKVNPSK